MSIGLTDIKICTRALVRLGSKGIDSFEDGTDKAITCEEVYTSVVESELSLYPWRFAMKKASLSRLADTPTNEYQYAYQLPTDRIGEPFAVFNSTSSSALVVKNYEIYADKLFTNETVCIIDYPFKPAESAFPAYFTEFLVLALASNMAMPITDSTSKAEYYFTKAYGTTSENFLGGALGKARRANSAQQPPQGLTDFNLTDVRN